MDLKSMSPRQLLAVYEAVLGELYERKIIRTKDAPLGQWAEWLARERLSGALETNSKKGYDLLTADWGRIQVKARMVRNLNARAERQLSVFRSFGFDQCLVLLFDPTYAVRQAVLIPVALVQQQAVRRDHVNGAVLFATPQLLSLGEDVTAMFQAES